MEYSIIKWFFVFPFALLFALIGSHFFGEDAILILLIVGGIVGKIVGVFMVIVVEDKMSKKK